VTTEIHDVFPGQLSVGEERRQAPTQFRLSLFRMRTCSDGLFITFYGHSPTEQESAHSKDCLFDKPRTCSSQTVLFHLKNPLITGENDLCSALVQWQLCKGDELRGARSLCLGLGGVRIDRAVSREIVQAVSPLAIEAAAAAAAKNQCASAEVQQAVRRELQQAKDVARLAKRRYEAVDPEKRLVAAELEARWESALHHVSEVERRLQELHSS